jgi:RND family efflux transporter MFP subunit
MKGFDKIGWLFSVLLSCPVIAGCGPSQAQPGPLQQTPEVLVSVPVTREVTDYVDFPGRTEAVQSIDVRARVTGYLDKVCFQEGADVKKGDLLFEIDPRPYKAALDQAVGNLVSMEARVKRLDAELARAKRLVGTMAISQEDHDKIMGDRGEAAASLQALTAGVERAQLDLTFTKVVAGVSGQISRRYIDPGNLVKADDTVLTTIVSIDPIYAYFDADERTTLRLQRLVRARKIKWSLDAGLPVLLGMADEDGFGKRGTINFADNRLDADTGTWRLRGVFANPDRSLSPGLFVRMRAPVGEPYRATLVSEEALGTDQGQKFLYVVTDKNNVEYRRVSVGRLHDGLRVITEGLAPGERIVVSGLQRVRPGIEVNPKAVDMPLVSAGPASKSAGDKVTR